jgi:SAM-dependent methyltransferase
MQSLILELSRISPGERVDTQSDSGRLHVVDPFDPEAVGAAYDAVADESVAAFAFDLDDLPLDRSILEQAAQVHTEEGPVPDLGRGPGQVDRYLVGRGLHVVGLDLTPRMFRLARRLTPETVFACGDMGVLPLGDGSYSGVAGFYSVHHLPRFMRAAALAEIDRVLSPRGVIVLATQLGDGEVYASEFLGHQIETVGGTLYNEAEVLGELARKSVAVANVRSRGPLAHEHQSQRIRVTARKSRARDGLHPVPT